MTDKRLVLQPLQLERVPLQGRTLIEASAGTGKTWTIAALYVRLLLERRLSVERILVLTFTNAATAELRTRIRARLVELRDALRGSTPPAVGDDALLAHVLRTTRDRHADALWLDAAAESFDLAPIHTIHGFCQRALAEHAFESGMAFDTELLGDDAELLEAAVLDCWRQDMRDAHPMWAAWLQDHGHTPVTMMARLQILRARPEAPRHLPPTPAADLERAYVEAYAVAREQWFAGADEAFAVLDNWKALHRRTYTSANLPKWRAQVAACLTPEEAHTGLANCLYRFTSTELAERAGEPAPAHPVFDALNVLHDAATALKAGFKARFVHWAVDMAERVERQLSALKDSRRLQSYDDLLRNLAAALAADADGRLAAALRERYAAALIDEFQDTDPLQYGIFEAIYAGSTQPRYYVGDPKQAIYAFRGADLHAYLRARREADAAYTLGVNRRSTPALVSAVNALFNREAAFLAEDIEFLPVDASQPAERLEVAGEEEAAALQCWFLPREAGQKALSKARAAEQVIDATADDIARLLSLAVTGGARLKGKSERPLAGRDIAVLVNRHEEARQVKAALAARGIASVTYGQDSVYHSPEAVELARVLAAVAEPTREVRLRAALATEMLGRDAQALHALDGDSQEWEAVLDRFDSYQRLAREHGFIRMWRTLMVDEEVAARLLALPDGERRLTNLQHLADLLHNHVLMTGADLESLVRLLTHARERPVGEAEAQQLRLESDEQLVQILTLHAAKGLEFAIVYCPLLWDGRLRSTRDEWLQFHDEQGELALDLGSAQQQLHRRRAEEEELGERLRLAYVALTRARHRCVFAWGGINEAETSALGWLLHGETDNEADRLASLRARFSSLDDAAMRAALAQRSAHCDGALAVRELPTATRIAGPHAVDRLRLEARTLSVRIPASWRVNSFSGLVARQDREAPDYDAILPAQIEQPSELAADHEDSLYTLPRGAHVGTLVHQLFESIDFQAAEGPQVSALVRNKLAEFDLESRWATVLERMLADVVATPLDADGLRLDQLGPTQRLIELEFLFPVDEPQLGALRAALEEYGPPGSRLPAAIGRLILAPTRGFIRGFIDLVFEAGGRYYLADYKSNWLGNQPEDYAPDALSQAMSEAYYDLQYLLYSVALHRHLRLCLPDYDYERHFGGVYYLFVRGMRPAWGPARGVYAIRPPAELISRLDELLGRSGPRLV